MDTELHFESEKGIQWNVSVDLKFLVSRFFMFYDMIYES